MSKKATQINFTIINNSKSVDESKLKIKLSYQDEEFPKTKTNNISYYSKFNEDMVYYCEIISIFFEDKIFSEFEYFIYINKPNEIILDLDEKQKPSFELLLQAKETNNVPLKVQYKNTDFINLETNENKYRRRIFFANVDQTKLEYINSETFKSYKYKIDNNSSYQTIIRFINNKNYEITLVNMDEFTINEIDNLETLKQINQVEIDKLKKLIRSFYENYKKFLDDVSTKNNENNKEKLVKAIDNLENLFKNIFINKMVDIFISPEKYAITDNLIELFHFYYYLNEYKIIKENSSELTLEKYIKEINTIIINHKYEKEIFLKLKEDNKLSSLEKSKCLETITIFFGNVLFSVQDILGVDYINIENIEHNNPYYKSNKLLKEIISDLTEDSRLFEAFLYFDSGAIQNLLLENKEKDIIYKDVFGQMITYKQPKYITEYGLSLMNVDEVKKHLFQLLPKIIIKIDTEVKLKALYEPKTKIMVINELVLFKTFIKENELLAEKDPDLYVIPICMEILHEMLGHCKLRYNRNKEISPLQFRDSKNNFQLKKVYRFVEVEGERRCINIGETGKVIENFICDNNLVIKALKKRYNAKNKSLINSKYWVGKSFQPLYDVLDIKEKEVSNFKDHLLADSDEDDNEDEYLNCIIYNRNI